MARRAALLHVVASAPAMDVPPPALDEGARDRLFTAMRKTAEGVPVTVAPEFLVREAESSHQGIRKQIVESRPGS